MTLLLYNTIIWGWCFQWSLFDIMMCKDFTHWNKLRSWVHSIIFNRPTISSALEYRQFSYSGELFSYPLHEIDEIINRLGLLKNQHKPSLQTHLRQRLPPKWSPLIGRLPGLAPFIWQMTAIYSKCGTFLKIKILLVEFRGYFPLEGPTFLSKYLFFYIHAIFTVKPICKQIHGNSSLPNSEQVCN